MQVLKAFVAMVVLSAGPAATSPDASARYLLSIAGVEIGEAALAYRNGGGRYALDFEGGFAFLFFNGGASVRVSGAEGAAGFQPETYALSFDGPTRDSKIDVAFDGVGPVDWSLAPPPEPEWIEGRIPIDKADLPGAVDPLTAFLIRAEAPDAACAHGAKIFTGFVRFDVALTTQSVDPSGVATCKVRYIPVSGHRAKSDGVDRLRQNGFALSLFELADGVWAPHRLGFRTSFGTLALERVE